MEIRTISADQTFALRQSILRPHQTIDDCEYDGDRDPGSFHLGAYVENELVTIASVYVQVENRFSQFSSEQQFRLRGMATAEPYRGQGFGAAVLQECMSRTWSHGGDVFWCNARTSAAGYYRKMGLMAIPEVFEIEGIGPHQVMYATRPSG